jgi:hypothetical protein
MARRSLFVCLTVGILALASAASATQSAVTGKMTVTGTNGDYVLTVENDATSSGPIRCWRWSLGQGAMVTAAARVDGWQLGLNKPAPAPIIAGRSDVGIPPGGKAQFRILTDKPFDGNGSPGEGAISETCQAGSDVSVQMSFGSPPKPEPKPEPEPEPKACTCKDLKTRIVANRSSVTASSAQGFQMELLVEWNLTCTKGAGTCTGELTLAPSARGKRLGIAVAAPAGTVTCEGPCAKTTKRFQKYVVTGGPEVGDREAGPDGQARPPRDEAEVQEHARPADVRRRLQPLRRHRHAPERPERERDSGSEGLTPAATRKP